MTAYDSPFIQPPMKPALVTGGAGFLGSHLVRRLVRTGWPVRVLERPGVDTTQLPKAVECVSADVRSASAVRDAMTGCGSVFHLAANPNLWARDPSEFEAINHQGTRHVLAAAAAEGVERFVHVSTELVVQPQSGSDFLSEPSLRDAKEMAGPYCASKRRGELAVREHALAGLPAIIVNPGVPVGAGDHRRGPFTRLIEQILEGRIKAVLDAHMALISVSDVATGIAAAAIRGEVGRRYVLVAEHWSMQRLLDVLNELTGRPMPQWRVPYALALSFAYCEELYCRLADRVPMASVAGVRLSRRPPREDAGQGLRELGVPITPCRVALRECVKWIEAVRAGRESELPAVAATGARE